MVRNFVSAAFILLILVSPPAVHAVELEVAVTGWLQSPEGEVSYGGDMASGSLDLEDDLQYDDEARVGGRLRLILPAFLPNLYVMATPMAFEGDGSKAVDFRFGDLDFEGDVPFYSELDLDHLDVALFYGIPLLETATAGFFRVELGLNARIIDFQEKIRQPESGLRHSESETIVIPMAYLAVRLTPFDRLAIEAEGRGLSVGEDHAYSIIGRLRLKLLGPLFGAAGYRYDVIKIEEEDIDTDVRVGGPFVELGLRF